ncbi:MAG: hydrogenase iron-sulfur subunit [Promethearchaeota archaeon]
MAGVTRNQYAPESYIVRVKCTGRVGISDIMQALRDGADGVGIFGCHKGECDFETGNLVAEQHVKTVKMMLEEHGFDPRRVEMYFMSAAEYDRFVNAVNDLTEKINSLPENPLKKDGSRGLNIQLEL